MSVLNHAHNGPWRLKKCGQKWPSFWTYSGKGWGLGQRGLVQLCGWCLQVGGRGKGATAFFRLPFPRHKGKPWWICSNGYGETNHSCLPLTYVMTSTKQITAQRKWCPACKMGPRDITAGSSDTTNNTSINLISLLFTSRHVVYWLHVFTANKLLTPCWPHHYCFHPSQSQHSFLPTVDTTPP